MNIVVDSLPLMSQKTGIGYYLENVLSEILRIDAKNNYYLSTFLSDRNEELKLIKGGISEIDLTKEVPHRVPFPFATAYLFMQRLKSILCAKKADFDIFWGANFMGRYGANFKTVITVHDMAHLYYPEMITEGMVDYLKLRLPEEARKAAAIIAVSRTTKDDIVNHLNIPEEKVHVVHNGIGPSYRQIFDEHILNSVKRKYSLPQSFILFVGTVQPRKNIELLIKCIYRLKNEFHVNLPLVIVGAKGWKSSNVFRLISELNVQADVIFPGYVDSVDLPVLYNLAEVFVFPSLYEGFGLPILEAMACGVPVVTSNVSSMPEIADDAAVLIDPSSVEDTTQGILTMLANKEMRDMCVSRGLERSKKFSWLKCAEETLAVFEGL